MYKDCSRVCTCGSIQLLTFDLNGEVGGNCVQFVDSCIQSTRNQAGPEHLNSGMHL